MATTSKQGKQGKNDTFGKVQKQKKYGTITVPLHLEWKEYNGDYRFVILQSGAVQIWDNRTGKNMASVHLSVVGNHVSVHTSKDADTTVFVENGCKFDSPRQLTDAVAYEMVTEND